MSLVLRRRDKKWKKNDFSLLDKKLFKIAPSHPFVPFTKHVVVAVVVVVSVVVVVVVVVMTTL